MKDRGIIKASKIFWEDDSCKDARYVLKREIEIVEEEFHPWMFIEPPDGVYVLYCRSDRFSESKYGANHQYDVTFTQVDDKRKIKMEVIP